jgi:hypothetical protein
LFDAIARKTPSGSVSSIQEIRPLVSRASKDHPERSAELTPRTCRGMIFAVLMLDTPSEITLSLSNG